MGIWDALCSASGMLYARIWDAQCSASGMFRDKHSVTSQGMAPTIIKTSDGFYALWLPGDRIIDTTRDYWYKPFIIGGYRSDDFKSMKKPDVTDFAQLMRIKPYLIGKTGKPKDKTVAQLPDDIKGEWGNFFAQPWEWEDESNDDESNDDEAEQSEDKRQAEQHHGSIQQHEAKVRRHHPRQCLL